jgi:hypothetical protein
MENNIKILVLIISSEHPHYIALENSWRKYMNNHPMITSKFLRCKPNIPAHEDGDTFYANCVESWEEGIFKKVIQAFEFYNKKYDLIFKTNLSSFIRLDKLYELAISLPKLNVYAGVQGYYYPLDIKFASGSGAFFSQDIVEKLIKRSIDYKGGIDDVMIGYFLNDIEITKLPRYDILPQCYFPTIDDIKDIYHIRNKLDDRTLEFKVFEHLYNMFYK